MELILLVVVVLEGLDVCFSSFCLYEIMISVLNKYIYDFKIKKRKFLKVGKRKNYEIFEKL